MLIEIYFPIADYETTKNGLDRFEGMHIRPGTLDSVTIKSPSAGQFGYLVKCEPTRASELVAEVVREGWVD